MFLHQTQKHCARRQKLRKVYVKMLTTKHFITETMVAELNSLRLTFPVVASQTNQCSCSSSKNIGVICLVHMLSNSILMPPKVGHFQAKTETTHKMYTAILHPD